MRAAGIALMWIKVQKLTQMRVDQRAGPEYPACTQKSALKLIQIIRADVRRLIIALDCSGRRDEIGLWERI